jgi:hypothetical protein
MPVGIDVTLARQRNVRLSGSMDGLEHVVQLPEVAVSQYLEAVTFWASFKYETPKNWRRRSIATPVEGVGG